MAAAGSPLGWRRWVDRAGDVVGVNTFGASARYRDNFAHYGLAVEDVVNRVRQMLRERT